jgi:hypothetical protein
MARNRSTIFAKLSRSLVTEGAHLRLQLQAAAQELFPDHLLWIAV